jgi:hypothetical protein
MTDRDSFPAFYAWYLTEHRHATNRALHVAAKVAALGALGVAVWDGSVTALVMAPVLAVVPCWVGHLLFERNRPAAWSSPSASLLGTIVGAVMGRSATGGAPSRRGRAYYSLLADLTMCRDILAGRGHARRVGE